MEWLEGLKESELFEAIKAALAIAVSLYPHELRRRRDAFAEQLFAPRPLESPQSDLLEPCDGLMLPVAGKVGVQNKQMKLKHHEQERRSRRQEEQDEPEEVEEHVEGQRNGEEQGGQEHESDEGIEGMDEEYDEAEALTDQMEEEDRQIQEINQIKMKITDLVLDDEELLELLCKLQKMQISVEALKGTEIGKEVNGLRKHSSKRISSLSKVLVREWKDLVDDWVKSAGDIAVAALAGSSSGSTQDDHGESGLPSPPLELGALLAAVHPPSAELFQLFDEDWDDELFTGTGPSPPRYDGGRAHIQPHCSELELQGRRSNTGQDPPVANMKSRSSASNNFQPLERGFQHSAVEGANASSRRIAKVSRVSSGTYQSQCPVDRLLPLKGTSHGVVRKVGSQSLQLIANRPKVCQPTTQALEDTSLAARLEVAKRRLQERYQEVENAKRSRVVQCRKFRQKEFEYKHCSGVVKRLKFGENLPVKNKVTQTGSLHE
ncbi:hypothetical protein BDL97_05G064300 [Sphagnum fallax]|nr:hypothetical protein BDL97_05G064300 [Sphagnum fallax]